MEVGIDIEEIERFNLSKNSTFIKKVFSKSEIEFSYLKTNPKIHLCGFYCAKEALIKTLEKNELPSDESYIIISHLNSGKPVIKLNNPTINKKYIFLLSISHTKNYATAIVIKKIKNEKL